MSYGVTVALQILVLSVRVRILVGQQIWKDKRLIFNDEDEAFMLEMPSSSISGSVYIHQRKQKRNDKISSEIILL